MNKWTKIGKKGFGILFFAVLLVICWLFFLRKPGLMGFFSDIIMAVLFIVCFTMITLYLIKKDQGKYKFIKIAGSIIMVILLIFISVDKFSDIINIIQKDYSSVKGIPKDYEFNHYRSTMNFSFTLDGNNFKLPNSYSDFFIPNKSYEIIYLPHSKYIIQINKL